MAWAKRGNLRIAVLLPLLSACVTTHGATVTSCDEASLRNAIDATPAGGVVLFDCSGTITLTRTLDLVRSVTLDGSGRQVTISGGGTGRCFYVTAGTIVTLRELTIADGRAVLPTQGGGIYNAGELSLANCRLLRNSAETGGGIYNIGILRASNTVFTSNVVRGVTGLAGAHGTHAIDMIDQFNRCRTTSPGSSGGAGAAGGGAAGGALYNLATAELMAVSVEFNSAIGGTGGNGGSAGHTGCTQGMLFGGSGGNGGNALAGGIYNRGNLRLTLSTVAENVTVGGQGGTGGGPGPNGFFAGAGGEGGAGYGAGIYNAEGTNLIENSTIAGNRSAGANGGQKGIVDMASGFCATGGGRGGDGVAGGIYNAGKLIAIHATVWNNFVEQGAGGWDTSNNTNCSITATQGPGGFALAASINTTDSAVLFNSIVGNLAYTNNIAGIVFDGGHNICSDATAQFIGPGSLNDTDPRLGQLIQFGGPTRTIPLLADSPARDAANSASCPATDQRGMARPMGAACDIGAFEGNGLEVFRLANGTIKVRAPVDSGGVRRLWASPNLQSWQVVASSSSTAGFIEYLEANPAIHNARFFKLD